MREYIFNCNIEYIRYGPIWLWTKRENKYYYNNIILLIGIYYLIGYILIRNPLILKFIKIAFLKCLFLNVGKTS